MGGGKVEGSGSTYSEPSAAGLGSILALSLNCRLLSLSEPWFLPCEVEFFISLAFSFSVHLVGLPSRLNF